MIRQATCLIALGLAALSWSCSKDSDSPSDSPAAGGSNAAGGTDSVGGSPSAAGTSTDGGAKSGGGAAAGGRQDSAGGEAENGGHDSAGGEAGSGGHDSVGGDAGSGGYDSVGGEGGQDSPGGETNAGGTMGEAGSSGRGGAGSTFDPGSFDGGCYDITAADVDDTCLSSTADIPTSLLNLVNNRRSALGEPNLSNPVDLSAEYESAVETALVERYPVIPLAPLDPADLANGTVEYEVPNVYGVTYDENGEVADDDMITLTCTLSGNTGTCTIENVQLDITDLVLDTIAGGDVNTPPAMSCMVTIGGELTITWTSDSEVHYAFAYDLDVVNDECANAIEALFPNEPCDQSYALELEEQGPVAGSGDLCSAYN